jgi:hypothetical protein
MSDEEERPPNESEMREELAKAATSAANGGSRRHGHLSFADGVEAALAWVLNDEPLSERPMK